MPPSQRRVGSDGRWVEARDLASGDVLATPSGSVRISGLASEQFAGEVSNLEAKDHGNYAVGRQGILVHNKGSAEPEPLVFRADQPFIYLIRDRLTGTILFMGRVTNL